MGLLTHDTLLKNVVNVGILSGVIALPKEILGVRDALSKVWQTITQRLTSVKIFSSFGVQSTTLLFQPITSVSYKPHPLVGGVVDGLQLWVNLPRRDKMMKPRYQEIPAQRIPTAQTNDGSVSVKVIAGEALGARAVIETQTPIMYLHFTLQPGAIVVQPVPRKYNAFTYVLDGEGLFGAGEERAGDGQMVLFAQDGEEVTIANPSDAKSPLDVLLIAGVPLNEPVVRYGPFVMNTEAEIIQAIEDYRNGRMGSIDF